MLLCILQFFWVCFKDVLCVHRSSDGVNKDPGGVPGELYPPPCVCIWAGSHLPQDREIW